MSFADERGYSEAVVSFETQNIFVNLDAINLSMATSLADSLRIISIANELSMDDFDHVVFLDMNVLQPSGGFAIIKTGIAKVGWLYGSPEVNQKNIAGIANAVYHHEIGHLWGWEHAWSDADTLQAFITNPLLFGWEDMNSNGTPDILD